MRGAEGREVGTTRAMAPWSLAKETHPCREGTKAEIRLMQPDGSPTGGT